MIYNYDTPENAIISLENACSNEDLENVILSKDFVTEAKIILRQASVDFDFNDEIIINESAELLELSLIQYMQEKGFPNFTGVVREFSELTEVEPDLFSIVEVLNYPDDEKFTNTIYLSKLNNQWKVVMTGE